MRRVIVNSTPLIILCKINRLDLLKELYGKVIIPQAVFAEVTAKADSVCQQIAGKEWIHVEYVEDQSEKKMYRAKLHDAETRADAAEQELARLREELRKLHSQLDRNVVCDALKIFYHGIQFFWPVVDPVQRQHCQPRQRVRRFASIFPDSGGGKHSLFVTLKETKDL